MLVEFKVQGKPPKKDGASSMWGKASEAENIVNLRNAALKARDELGIGPFTGKVGIELTMYVEEKVIESLGDLDNFITGVCDGLQAADPRANMHETIFKGCSPYEPVLFFSDAKVYDIHARKVPIEGKEGYYVLKVFEL